MARAEQPARLVDVTKGEIAQSGGGDLLLCDRVVGAVWVQRVAVEHHDVYPAVLRRGEAAQQAGFVGRFEARAEDAAVLLRQFNGRNGARGENMDIHRPSLRAIGRGGGEGVMVSRREKDRARARGKRRKQGLDGFRRDRFAVEHVAREEQRVAAVDAAQLGELRRKLALFFAARGGLLGAESGKRRIEVQVGCVEQFNQGASPSLRWCSGGCACRP